MIHNTIDAARARLKGDKDGRAHLGVDLPPPGRAARRALGSRRRRPRSTRRRAPRTGAVYEVIDARRPCWAYFDLEFTRGRPQRGCRRHTRSMTAVPRLRRVGGRRRRPPLEIEVIGLASAQPKISSRHVVLRFSDGRHAAAGAARRLAARRPSRGVVIEALGDALTVQSGDARTTTSFVDTGVYTRRRPLLPRLGVDDRRGDVADAAFADGATGVPRLPARRVYAVAAPRDAGRT